MSSASSLSLCGVYRSAPYRNVEALFLSMSSSPRAVRDWQGELRSAAILARAHCSARAWRPEHWRTQRVVGCKRQRRASDSRCYSWDWSVSEAAWVAPSVGARVHIVHHEANLEVNRTASSTWFVRGRPFAVCKRAPPFSSVARRSSLLRVPVFCSFWESRNWRVRCPLKEPHFSRISPTGAAKRIAKDWQRARTHGSLSPVIQHGMSLLLEFRGVSERRWSFQRPL